MYMRSFNGYLENSKHCSPVLLREKNQYCRINYNKRKISAGIIRLVLNW